MITPTRIQTNTGAVIAISITTAILLILKFPQTYSTKNLIMTTSSIMMNKAPTNTGDEDSACRKCRFSVTVAGRVTLHDGAYTFTLELAYIFIPMTIISASLK